MGEKHLIVLDLDGTLLRNDHTISPKTKKVLKKAQEKGHYVMIATGRPYRSSEIYYKELGLKTPIVNFNGAFIHHPLNSNWGLHHSPLDMPVVKDIIDICHNHHFENIIAEVMDDIYFHYHDEKLINLFSLGNPTVTTGDLRQYLNTSPTSLLIQTDEKHIKKIRKHLKEVHADFINQRSWNGPWHVIEIVKKGLNKAVGIKKVAEELNIPRKQIIAFGDEDNDLEMIEYAGKGIAMGNGIDELKRIADDTTLSNEEDGIGVYLNDYLKLNVF